MVDLTLNKEDKDTYIIDLILNEDNTYTVTYASGRVETYPFSIHNYQVELLRMEEQVKKYGDSYIKRVWNNGPVRGMLVGMMLMADVFYLFHIIENGPNILNILLLITCLIQQSFRIREFFTDLINYVGAKRQLDVINAYLENKEQFKVSVQDNKDRNEDWYLVDLGNIDQFRNVKALNDYVLSLSSEVKEAQGISFTKNFKQQA